MDASCKIQRSIHDVRLTYKYVSRILGTYHYWSCKPGSLAKLIDKADQMSADQITEMGWRAKKRVAEEYTWDKICGQYEDVFLKYKKN